ncbi:hypothetical protein [Acinetobacter baylyi]|nr:hypothetical protein [Acinetobacter baylyi]
MRAISKILCLIVLICLVGLPFIGMIIAFWLFVTLVEYAFGEKNK